jgi:hypothetical protein
MSEGWYSTGLILFHGLIGFIPYEYREGQKKPCNLSGLMLIKVIKVRMLVFKLHQPKETIIDVNPHYPPQYIMFLKYCPTRQGQTWTYTPTDSCHMLNKK